MNNMQQMLANAQKLQAKIAAAQKELEDKEVSGTSGSGSVNVVVKLDGNIQSISINKDVIDPEEKEMLEDLILAALKDAKTNADKLYKEGMDAATGGLKIPGLGNGLF